MIEGVKVTPLKQIFDERGKVMHMLSARFFRIKKNIKNKKIKKTPRIN